MNFFVKIFLVLTIIFLIIIVIKRKLIRKINYVIFYLNNKYYGSGLLKEINHVKLSDLIKNKESFAVFIHQPFCTTSYEFNKVLIKFAEEYSMSFYKITFEEMQLTELGKDLKYYPSFAIYHTGKLVDFLKADKDKDLNYYKTMNQFKEWFSKYVAIYKEEEIEEKT